MKKLLTICLLSCILGSCATSQFEYKCQQICLYNGGNYEGTDVYSFEPSIRSGTEFRVVCRCSNNNFVLH